VPAKIKVLRDRRGRSISGPIPHFPEFDWLGLSKTTGTICVRRHKHPGMFEICLFMRGHVTMYARERVYQLRGGDVFIAWPGEPHGALQDVMQPCTHWYFAFGLPRPGAAKSVLGLPHSEARALSKAVYGLSSNHLRGAQKLEPYCEAIFSGLESSSNGSAVGVTQARAALQSLLVALIALPPATTQSGVVPPGISRVREFLESCPAPWPTIKDLAEISGMSVSHFCACFSQWIGAAPLKYSHHMRLRRARELLADPRTSVTSVALRLGYCSSQHLAACFQQYLGQSPRAIMKSAALSRNHRHRKAITSS